MNSSFPPPHVPARARLPRDLAERQVEALTVAMIVAPGVYTRNRRFDLFTLAGARRARTRAGVVRGLVAHLARATSVTLTREGSSFVLRYVIPAVRLTRVVELSAAELAALRLVAERANIACLPPESDRELIAQALSKLMDEAP